MTRRLRWRVISLSATDFEFPRVEAYNSANWQTFAPDTDVTYNGIGYNTNSANLDRSIQKSIPEPNLLRFQLNAGDEWASDAGRNPAYDRAELGSYSPYMPGETWFSFATKAYGSLQPGNRSIFQIYNDQVEFQLQSTQLATNFVTYDSNLVVTNRHAAARLVDGYADQWVIRFKPDPSAGEMQAWRNGVQLFNLSGMAFGTSAEVRKFKYGPYMQRVAGTQFVIHYANLTRSSSSLLSKVSIPDPLPNGW